MGRRERVFEWLRTKQEKGSNFPSPHKHPKHTRTAHADAQAHTRAHRCSASSQWMEKESTARALQPPEGVRFPLLVNTRNEHRSTIFPLSDFISGLLDQFLILSFPSGDSLVHSLVHSFVCSFTHTLFTYKHLSPSPLNGTLRLGVGCVVSTVRDQRERKAL